jgi:hypothetical protein
MTGVVFLYLGIFVILVMIQFTQHRGFIRHIGPMTVSGRYGESPIRTANVGGEAPARRPLAGGVTVSFGGMEFNLHDDGEFVFLRYTGEREALLPQFMSVYGNSVRFDFADGMQLVFDVLSALDEGEGLRITGQFKEEYAGLELPYRAMRTSRIRDAGNGQFIVTAERTQYSFGSTHLNGERRVLLLDVNERVAYYQAVQERTIPEQQGFIPDDFILAAARDNVLYSEAVNRWRDEAYSLWSRTVRTTDNEDVVVAYAGESASRGVYEDVMASIPSAFLRRAAWTYKGAVYLGRLDLGLRSLSSFERDAVARLSSLVSSGSEDVFLESHVVEFCGIRGYDEILDGIAELALSLDPAYFSPAVLPGILEGYTEWRIYCSPEDNPFESLVESVCRMMYDGMKQNSAGDRVLYFGNGHANLEYNLRLGLALDRYGRISNQETWGALGRSLVISVLSFFENGSLPAGVTIPEAQAGEETEPPDIRPVAGEPGLDFLALYHLFPSAVHPHAVSIGAQESGVWAWTASDSVTVSQENNILDIAVSFPIGETHYMLIRGLRPFTKIQLYGIDYRTDPRFESYDSSGWSFSSSERTLLLKLKHRSQVEHIRMFY